MKILLCVPRDPFDPRVRPADLLMRLRSFSELLSIVRAFFANPGYAFTKAP